MNKLSNDENLMLVGVSITDSGKVKVSWIVPKLTLEAVHEVKHTIECTLFEDDEFAEAISAMKIHIARDNFMGGEGLIGKEEKDLDDKTLAILDKLYDNLEVLGITLVGAKRDMVQIKGKLKGVNGDYKTVMTGKLHYKEPKNGVPMYKFWESLGKHMETLKKETIKYVNSMYLLDDDDE